LKKSKKPIDETGFSLTTDNRKDIGYAQRLVTSLILYVGLVGCIWTVLGLDGIGISPILALVVGCVYCAAFCGLRGRWRFIYIPAVIVILIYFYATWSYMSNGWNAVANQVYQTFEVYLGRILPRYAISVDNPALSAGMFLVMASAVLGILCGFTAAIGGAFSLVSGLLVVALWLVALILQVQYPVVCVVALVAAAVVLLGMRNPTGSGFAGRAWKQLIVTAAILLCVSVLVAVPLNELNSNADSARRNAERRIDAIRYDAEDDTAPEGDFDSFSDFAPMSDVDFYIAQYSGDIYYLRGYVGESYTGSGWESLKPERRAEYAEIFNWLHNRGFYAQYQYSALRSAIGKDTDAPIEITVINEDAYSKFLYAPYEAVADDPDIYRIGDENLLADGLKGEREYTLAISGGFVSDYESLFNELNSAFALGNTDVIEYLKSENAYREFVYENYLEIPEETRLAIQNFLDGYVPGEDGVSFNDAKTIVSTYIGAMSYSDTPEAVSYSGDFVSAFLMQGWEGNSLHFSAVQTLLFRYLGIPARYVEGYIVTEDELRSAQQDGVLFIRTENIRAWTEIYREGVGFVPFELAPPRMYEPEQMMIDQYMEPEPVPSDPDSPSVMLLKILLLILAVAAGLFVIGFTVLAIRRIIIRRRYKKIQALDDNGEAVSQMTTLLIWMVSHAGILYENGSLYGLCSEFERLFGQNISEKYSKVIRIQQRTIFGNLSVSDEERTMVTEVIDEVAVLLTKQAGFFRRLKLKWIDCVI